MFCHQYNVRLSSGIGWLTCHNWSPKYYMKSAAVVRCLIFSMSAFHQIKSRCLECTSQKSLITKKALHISRDDFNHSIFLGQFSYRVEIRLMKGNVIRLAWILVMSDRSWMVWSDVNGIHETSGKATRVSKLVPNCSMVHSLMIFLDSTRFSFCRCQT
jgi:hypothetical protein